MSDGNSFARLIYRRSNFLETGRVKLKKMMSVGALALVTITLAGCGS